MKKCPTCEKTFDDNLRFCQTDGTALVDVVEDAPIQDPYKTTVARPDEIAAAIPSVDPFQTMVGGTEKSGESGDLLQLPEEHDPLKTMFVSENELRKEMESNARKEDVIDLPPIESPFSQPKEEKAETQAEPFITPEPPKFNEPSLSPPSFGDTPPSFGNAPSSPFDNSPIGSEDKTIQVSSDNPFSAPPPIEISPYNSFGDESANRSTGRIPSPFDKAKPTSFDPPLTPLPTYKEAEPKAEESNNPFAPTPFGKPTEAESPFAAKPFDEPVKSDSPFAPTPFGQSSAPVNAPLANSDWTPPPAPEASWQNQQIGQNTPFQPPVSGGQDQTLAIVSLVLGIVGIVFCQLTGPVALVTGFMARKKAAANPSQFGGEGLALAGIITGIIGTIFLLLIIAYFIFVFLIIGASVI